ncbi:hypothetical protein NAEGRDRAFT_78922 [Naegleria gruberi]|uniref:Uncharacterized protein n=1 Tax=Naegleria gruberi TaxID=5762 RepID=D2V7N9_NAEGR|nr:uncharacterized protein NAEGRDRAFT_78922 [Naegleria gruberi]EFC47034.1 hypothetical protein NAEGRDRAFT_78922 [Naegleria gruberi]|eukprot:XP_002679778.1 hypothetical protein NAEGRDRAFT_78922 [Naegleria gruberi strain NEG-M]
MSANNILKKKSVIYDKDAGGVYKKKLRKIFTSTDPEMNPHNANTHHFDSSNNIGASDSFSALLMDATTTNTANNATSSTNHHQNTNSNGHASSNGHSESAGSHHDITVKPFYNIGDIVMFRERSQTVDQIGFVYHKKASSLHEKERIPKCVVYMLSDEKYWVLEWLLMKENNIEAGERTFESSEKSSPPPLNAPSTTSNLGATGNNSHNSHNGHNNIVNNNMTSSKSNNNLNLLNNLMGSSNNNNNMEIPTNGTNPAQNGSLNNSLMTSRFGHHHTQNGNVPNGFLNNTNGHYHGITKSTKTSSSSIQLSQHLTSLLSSLDSKFSNPSAASLTFDNEATMMDDEDNSEKNPFSSSSNQIPQTLQSEPSNKLSSRTQNAFHTSSASATNNNTSPPHHQNNSVAAVMSAEVKELLLSHPFLSQKNVSTSNQSQQLSSATTTTTSSNRNANNSSSATSSQPNLTRASSSSNINSNSVNNNNNNNNNNTTTTMEKLAQQSQFNLFGNGSANIGGGNDGGSMMGSGANGLHHSMNSMRRIPSNGNIGLGNNMGNMNQLFASDVNDANSQLKKQIVLNHIQQRQQLVNQQLMELLNQQNRRPMSSFPIPSSKYDLNLLNIANNYQYNITPSYGPYSQPAIVSFNHNFELRPTDMLQFLIIQVKDGQNLKAFCVNPVISYDNDTLVALNDLSNRVTLVGANGNIPNLDEELSKFVHSSPLLVTLPPQEEPSNVLIVLMKNFIPITSPLLFEYTP